MDPIVVLTACALIAWLFASASLTKLHRPLQMMGIIDNYRVLTFSVSKNAVILLAVTEMAIALAVLLPASRQWGALSAIVLLCIYSLAIGINLARGRTEFDCGCSGPAGRKTIGSSLLWRNALLVATAALAMAPLIPRQMQWLDYTVILLAAAFFILIYQIVENLLVNHQLLIKLLKH